MNLNLYDISNNPIHKFKVMKDDRLWLKSCEPFDMTDNCDNMDLDYGNDLRSYSSSTDFLVRTVRDIMNRGAASYEILVSNNGKRNKHNSVLYPLSHYNAERRKEDEFKRILRRFMQ